MKAEQKTMAEYEKIMAMKAKHNNANPPIIIKSAPTNKGGSPIENKVKNGILGVIIGDALGVPFEFKDSNEILEKYTNKEITSMEEVKEKTYNVPAGTYSDDGAQTLCLLDYLIKLKTSMSNQFDADSFRTKLIGWIDNGDYQVDNRVFDYGNQTYNSLKNTEKIQPLSNEGNGALMRSIPVPLLYKSVEDIIDISFKHCSVTHNNETCKVACALYSLWAHYIIDDHSVKAAYNLACEKIKEKKVFDVELSKIENHKAVKSSGWVLDTFALTKHLLFSCNSYEEVVVSAIKLGGDTDTLAAVSGGIAALAFNDIPLIWCRKIRGREIWQPLIEKCLKYKSV